MRRRIVLAMLLAIAALSWACTGSSPSAAVKAFYRAIGDGDTDKAVGLLSQQIVNTVGVEKLRAGIQKASRDTLEKGGVKDLEITNEQVAGDVATVDVVIKYGNGTAETQKVQLVKEKGGWRLQPEK
jgi:uncharacterized membrane protein YvbJ